MTGGIAASISEYLLGKADPVAEVTAVPHRPLGDAAPLAVLPFRPIVAPRYRPQAVARFGLAV